MKHSGLVFCLAAAMIAGTGGALAGERPLMAGEIRTLLDDRTVAAADGGRTQHFSAGGATRYQRTGGTPSDGRWDVRDPDQYCSQWPPSGAWSCYRMRYDAETGTVTWTDAAGDSSSAVLQAR